MILRGKVYKFGNNITTDGIISGRYKFSITDMKKLSRYLFEDIRPDFFKKVIPRKTIVAAGENFGMGSSREQAPWVIKEAGISCVIAKSFARLFLRNAFNIGLPLIKADTRKIIEGDFLILDLDKGKLHNQRNEIVQTFIPWNNFQKELIVCGGIIRYLKKHKKFNLE